MKVGSPVGGEGHHPDQFWLSSSASNNAHSSCTSEAINSGQGRKIGPNKHFHRNAIHSCVLNTSSHLDFATSSPV